VRLRWLVVFHRWAGVILCLLFTTWFASGAVLHFVPFPSLSLEERVQRAEAINAGAIAIRPAAALELFPASVEMRIVSVMGRPVYVLQASDGRLSAVDAETGHPVSNVSPSAAETIAGAFMRAQPSAVEGPFDFDQWTVPGEYDPYRPLLRVEFDDSAGSVIYVSERSGEVVLRTTAHERRWNWVGAVVHWIYFKPLRSHWAAWDRLVWWVALIAVCSTFAGLWLGVVRYLTNRRAHRPGLTPFRGWLGWHHRIGLVAGLVVLAWIFSGWLSMDHGRLFSRSAPTPGMVANVRGISMDSIAASATFEALQSVGNVSQIDFSGIAGRPFIVARGGAGAGPRIVWLDGSDRPSPGAIPTELLLEGVRAAWPGEAVTDRGTVTPAELYGLAESIPVGARAFRTERSMAVDSYVDPISGRLLVVMDASRRAYAWSYYAMHTLKFPGLASHPLLRSTITLTLLALGFLFSLTGAVVGISRLRKTLASSTYRRL
jgi:hypothetical protein